MLKNVLCVVLALFMIMAGVLHFKDAEIFASIVPDFLPWPTALVYISGVVEILGGLGLLIPHTRCYAAWLLIALFICVFPANVYMAVKNIPIRGEHYPVASWVRLPFQLVFIAWAYWYAKPRRQS